MSEKVKCEIFEIVATENLYFDTAVTSLCGVVFKICRKLV